MPKAKEKTRVIAETGGFKLGKLVSLTEGIFLPQPLSYEAMEVEAEVALIIKPGSQEIQITVTLTYEIK